MKSPRRFTWVGMLICTIGFAATSVLAQQSEVAVDCNEDVIVEPVGLAYGEHTDGCAIEEALDRDSFSFAGTTGDEVRISLRSGSSGFDPRIELRDPMGDLLSDELCSGASGACSFSIQLILLKSGTYFITVSDSGSNETGNYTLQLELVNSTEAVPQIDYDSDDADTISPGTDQDFFVFAGTASTVVRLNVRSLSSGFDPRLEVRQPDGSVIYDDFCNGAAGACSFSANFILAATGTYLVSLSDQGVNETGNYLLSLWCLDGPCDGVPDPIGKVISYFSANVDTVSPVVDGDYFVFNGTADTEIRLNLRSTSSGFDPRMEMRDPAGALILEELCSGAAGACTLSFDRMLGLSGNYTVLVSDSGTNETGSYELSVHCLSGVCESDFDADGVADGSPPALPYDTPTARTITPATDVDAFRILVSDTTDTSITVASSTSGFDPAIEIRDDTGLLVLDAQFCSGAAGACNFTVPVDETWNGEYTVAVFDLGINETGSYTIAIDCLFPPASCTDPPVLAASDNCVELPNGPLLADTNGFLQTDSDGDGIGNACDLDADQDCDAGFSDLNLLKLAFFTKQGDKDYDVNLDYDNDGTIGFGDLNALKLAFFRAPGPGVPGNFCD